MKPKNTICLWFDRDAHEAARFYAATFPNSEVTAVHKAPGDFPGGKEGDVLTVEFTVLGIPCFGLTAARSSSTARRSPSKSPPTIRKRPTATERDRQQWGQGKSMWLVQGPLGPVLANHAACPHGRPGRRRR